MFNALFYREKLKEIRVSQLVISEHKRGRQVSLIGNRPMAQIPRNTDMLQIQLNQLCKILRINENRIKILSQIPDDRKVFHTDPNVRPFQSPSNSAKTQ